MFKMVLNALIEIPEIPELLGFYGIPRKSPDFSSHPISGNHSWDNIKSIFLIETELLLQDRKDIFQLMNLLSHKIFLRKKTLDFFIEYTFEIEDHPTRKCIAPFLSNGNLS